MLNGTPIAPIACLHCAHFHLTTGSQASVVIMERTFTGYPEMRALLRWSKRNGWSQLVTHLARLKWCRCELGRRSLGSWLERAGVHKWLRAVVGQA